MKRTWIAFGVLLATWVPAADAAPAIARRVWATAAYELVVSSRDSVRVEIYADVDEVGTTGGASRLQVALSRCRDDRCGRPVHYAEMLPAGAFVVDGDLKRATLRAKAFGRALQVSWAGDNIMANDVKAELYKPVLPTGQVRVFLREQRSGSGRGLLFGRSCRTISGVIARDSIVDGVTPVPLPAIPGAVPSSFRDVFSARCA